MGRDLAYEQDAIAAAAAGVIVAWLGD